MLVNKTGLNQSYHNQKYEKVQIYGFWIIDFIFKDLL